MTESLKQKLDRVEFPKPNRIEVKSDYEHWNYYPTRDNSGCGVLNLMIRKDGTFIICGWGINIKNEELKDSDILIIRDFINFLRK